MDGYNSIYLSLSYLNAIRSCFNVSPTGLVCQITFPQSASEERSADACYVASQGQPTSYPDVDARSGRPTLSGVEHVEAAHLGRAPIITRVRRWTVADLLSARYRQQSRHV